MEASLRSALKLGLTASEFWALTPYNVSMRLKELGTARIEKALYIGWFAERFAREERLQPAQHYVSEMLNGAVDPDLTAEMAEAELSRMAMAWGLDVEEIEDSI